MEKIAAANTIPAYILMERIIITGMCAADARVRSTYFGFSWRDIICALKPVGNVKGLHFWTQSCSRSHSIRSQPERAYVQLVSN